jgi:hypothetical protein
MKEDESFQSSGDETELFELPMIVDVHVSDRKNPVLKENFRASKAAHESICHLVLNK